MQGITFRAFMARALYGAGGYYTDRRPHLGRSGDFFTNAHVSPLYGELWASFALSRIAPTGGRLVIVELGCGDGDFASAFLPPLVAGARAMGVGVLYAGIDVSGEARRRASAVLERVMLDTGTSASAAPRSFVAGNAAESTPGREWFDYLTAPDAATAVRMNPELRGGWVFGNEVLDALPCDIVRVSVSDTLQLFVAQRPVAAGQVPGPFRGAEHDTVFRPADASCRAYAARYLRPFAGRRGEYVIAEAHTQLGAFVDDLLVTIEPQAVAFVDYGGFTADMVAPDRPNGTLRAYCGHRVSDAVLDAALDGQCDLTYDVDFTAVADALSERGYDVSPVQRQGAFFVALPDFSRVVEAHMAVRPNPSLAVRQLVLPGAMGDRFLVCLAERRATA